MDLSRLKKVYMIGIKGVGMTMLAQFFKARGIEVTGSDGPEKFMTDEILKKNGIKIIENFNPENLKCGADLIVYSTAYNKDNNTEVNSIINSSHLSSLVLSYPEALAKIFNNHFGIAVCGSHGKTTTTAWLGFVAQAGELKPNVLVGSIVPQFNGAALVEGSNYFIAETDEYQNKLQYFQPRGVILNNIDYDHPDFFPDEADYLKVFENFIVRIPAKGFLTANCDDENIFKLLPQVKCKILGYGLKVNPWNNSKNDYLQATDIQLNNGLQYFKVYLNQDDLGVFSIQLSGKHNIYNALAVIATALELEIDLKIIREALSNFKGTVRRMQILGEFKGALIIDDYAHHPTEIKTTLEGARANYQNKQIITVFHPHTFTRTKALFNDFVKSFSAANELIVLDIYGSAREKQGGVSSQELIKAIKDFNLKNNIKQTVKYLPKLNDCEKYLRANTNKNNLILLMGAGDVFRIGEKLINY